jgi:signal transduction histidine kinase
VDRYAKRTRLAAQVIVDMNDPNERFSRELETACFRIAQEALTNVVRHAHAKGVILRLVKEDSLLRLSVKDDGVGFDPETLQRRAPRAATLGLLGMLERAHAAGGDLEIDSKVSQGTEIRLKLPLVPQL